MLIDGLTLVEGSTVTNLVLASGTTNPSNPNVGELFYRSDSQAIVVYNGTAWTEVTGGGAAGSTSTVYVGTSTSDVSPTEGTAFYADGNGDSAEGLYVYSGGNWVQVTGAGSIPSGLFTADVDGDVSGTIVGGDTATLTLSSSGVAAGTYTKVTVDAKGRVTTATNLTAGDIPVLSYLTGNQSISVSGDASGSGATSINLTLANSGVAAGTYTKVTVDSKGRVTTATTLTAGDIPSLSATYQPLDADLTAIAGLVGTIGILKKTAADTWALDTSTYLTSNQSITVSGDATGSGATAIALTLANSGVTAGTYTKVTVDAKGRVTTATTLTASDIPSLSGTYLTGNQSITVSGDASGSGATSINLTLANSGVTAGTYGAADTVPTVTVDAKGRVTSASTASIAIAASQITSGTLSDSRVAASNVTQHQASLTIAETQITDGSLLARVGSDETISGTWTFSNPVTVGSPVTGSHAATKDYVDNSITGLDMKASVRVATTADITLSGTQTIDGVAVVAGNRVLVKDQNTPSQNGIYVVAAGAWSRATDADNTPDGEVTSGMYTFVEEGTTNADSGWVLSTNNPITLGNTGLTFVQFNGLGQVTAGSGLTKSGNTMNVISASADRVVVNADSIDLATTGTAGTYTKLTTDAYGRVVSGTTLSAGDIPALSQYVLKAGDTMTGTLTGTNFYAGAGTTSSPSLSFSADSNTGIYSPAADVIGFVTTGTERMRIDSSGNVGIGTFAPQGKLDISGAASDSWPGGSANNGLVLNGCGINTGTSTIVTYLDNSSITIGAGVTQKTGILITGQTSGAGSTVQFRTGNAERMRITSAGNFGFGTAAPEAIANYVTLESSGTTGGIFQATNGTQKVAMYVNATNGYAGTRSNHPFLFVVNASERMRLDTGGNLGLGATPSSGISGIPVLQINNAQFGSLGGPNGHFFITSNAYPATSTDEGFATWNYINSAARATKFDSRDGNFRWWSTPTVGTAGSTITFTNIMSLDYAGALLHSSGTTSSPSLSFVGDTNTGIYNPAPDTIGFVEGGAEAMRIDSSGNIGIGTTTPASKLHVSGDIQQDNANYLKGKLAAGTATRLFGLNAVNTLYIGSIDADHTGGTLFVKNGVMQMTLDASGNLAIGTSTAFARLHVGSVANNSRASIIVNSAETAFRIAGYQGTTGVGTLVGDFGLEWNDTKNAMIKFYRGGSTTGGFLAFTTDNDTERMRLDVNGNLLVGTTASSTYLTQFSAGSKGLAIMSTVPTIALVDDEDTANDRSWIAQTSGDLYISNRNTSTGKIIIQNAGTERMRIDTSGRVLIGTASAAGQLPAGSVQLVSGAHIASDTFGRIFVPSQQIGTASYAGLYGLATTYLAYYDAGWKSLGGGTASAITVDEGIFSFCNSNSVAAAGSTLTWTTRLMINTSGNVGVGVTPSSWGSQYKAIQIPTGQFASTPAGAAVSFNQYHDGTVYRYVATGSASMLAQDGTFKFYTAASGTAGTTATFTQSMTLDANGQLGVMATPTASISLKNSGNINFAGPYAYIDTNSAYSSAADRYLVSSSPAARYSQIDGAHSWYSAPAGTATNVIPFSLGMTLNASGNLGIGTTSPTTKLHVNGGNTNTEVRIVHDGNVPGRLVTMRLGPSTSNYASSGVYMQAIQGSGIDVYSLAFGTTYATTTASERMRITHVGDVGIGTADTTITGGVVGSSSKFVVSGSAGRVQLADTGNEIAFSRNAANYISANGGTSSAMIVSAQSYVRFDTGATLTERMRLDTSGNLGIGNASPVNKLDVTGSFGRGAPVTKVADFSVGTTENWLIVNKSGSACTVTLPTASSWTGREIMIKTIQAQAVNSNASNVVPLAGGAAGTAILTGTAGKWATLVSDGTNWIIMAGA